MQFTLICDPILEHRGKEVASYEDKEQCNIICQCNNSFSCDK